MEECVKEHAQSRNRGDVACQPRASSPNTPDFVVCLVSYAATARFSPSDSAEGTKEWLHVVVWWESRQSPQLVSMQRTQTSFHGKAKVSNVASWAQKPLKQTGVIITDAYLKILYAANNLPSLMIFVLISAEHAAHKYITKSLDSQYNKSCMVFLH